MAVEIALAIPPGKRRVPKGILGPLAEQYVVGPDLNVNDLGFFASVSYTHLTLPTIYSV